MKFRLFANIRKRWDSYIFRLGEANKKNFGNGPLECCKLGQYENADGKAHK